MAPEHGPRPLFFSGGSALRGLSRELVERRVTSRHIVTPFDAGGSSAELRRVLRMPAVGDLRNRLLSLADPTGPAMKAPTSSPFRSTSGVWMSRGEGKSFRSMR